MEQVMGWAETGGTSIVIPGTQGSGTQRFQQSFRGATVTVRDSSNNLATIYSDDLASPTAKANPFTASSTTGSWSFFAATGTYTVTFSGASITAPFSITVNLGLGNAGGVPSYAYASLPTSKSQNAGDIARVTNLGGSLWMDSGSQWFQINPVVNAAEMTGVDAGAKITAAIARLPSTGGTVDARGFEGAQTAASGIVMGSATKPITLLLGAATISLGGAITLYPSSRITGIGFGSNDFTIPATVLTSATSDLFNITSSSISGVVIEQLEARSLAGGGHIFNLNAGTSTRSTFRHLVLIQDNAAKSIFTNTTNGSNFLENWIENSDMKYAAANSVPAIHIKTDAINVNHFKNIRITGNNAQSGTYAIWLENTNVSGIGQSNRFTSITCETTGGGCINLLSMTATSVNGLWAGDLTLASNNPTVHVGAGTVVGTLMSRNISLSDIFVANNGTSAKPDIQFDGDISGAVGFELRNSWIGWLAGASVANGCDAAGCAPILLLNTYLNLGSRDYNTIAISNAAPNSIEFNTDTPTSKSYSINIGTPGNFDGYLWFSQNSTKIAGIAPSGNVVVGPNPASPTALITPGGVVQPTTLTVLSTGTMTPGRTTVAALPSAAASAGLMVVVTDSTAIAAEGQTCVGGAAVVALAFSDGGSWKCF